MISPAMIKSEMDFLETLGFTTNRYTKRKLNDSEFVRNNPEAILAKKLFGTDKNVGSARIDFKTISTPEWKAKKQAVVEDYKQKGIEILSDQSSTDEK